MAMKSRQRRSFARMWDGGDGWRWRRDRRGERVSGGGVDPEAGRSAGTGVQNLTRDLPGRPALTPFPQISARITNERPAQVAGLFHSVQRGAPCRLAPKPSIVSETSDRRKLY